MNSIAHETSVLGVTAEDLLLSFCLFGRDDDYMPDFRYRITTTINYLAHSLAQLGRLSQVEIVVTDWGSDVPMAKTLPLSGAARQITRFIFVSPEAIARAGATSAGVHVTKANNVALRRAKGRYVVSYAADTLITRSCLGSLFSILEGTTPLPVPPDKAFMLLQRYQVPWQFVQREPSIEEWERYLFLNTAELSYEPGVLLGVFSGAGALMMHRDLWAEIRGMDEKFGSWGFCDNDMGLRLSQEFPWVALASEGINLYHMEHPAVGRRVSAVRFRNPRIYNRTVPANDDAWGLGDISLPDESATESEAAVTDARKPDQPLFPPERVIAELTDAQLARHISGCLTEIPSNRIGKREVEALFFLAWHALRRCPRTYVEYQITRAYAAAVVTKACPSVEVYGIDEWGGTIGASGIPVDAVCSLLRNECGHYAHERYVNGDMRTAIARLKNSFVGDFFIDLAFLRGDFVGDALKEQLCLLLDHLAVGGAIVVTTEAPGAWEDITATFRERRLECLLFLSRTKLTGMIVRERPCAVQSSGQSAFDCSLDAGKVTRRLVPGRVVARRVVRGLCQPLRYPEFVRLALSRLKRR